MKEEKSEDSISDDDLSQFSVSEQSDVVESPEDPIVAAAQLKDEGNVKFKVKKYGEAIDLYTKAHGESITIYHTSLCSCLHERQLIYRIEPKRS